jgi:hypothetical protein
VSAIDSILAAFADELQRNFAVAGFVPAQAEDQLKAPIVAFLQSAGPALSAGSVVARTEAIARDYGVRPDIGVSVANALTGHVELKAPGKGARARAFTDPHDRAQFKRLSGHPNLLYTDGSEWVLYRLGQQVGQTVRASGDVTRDGSRAYTPREAAALEVLLADFLRWQPLVPSTPAGLAVALAPLARLLREAVLEAIQQPTSALATLAEEWRGVLFSDADDAEFADAYAQTVTYALLLARVDGETDLRGRAADRLDSQHGLLAQVLRVLAQPAARAEVEIPISLLERIIAAVDPAELERRSRHRDLWLYFYEDFLAAYDPRLRKQRGVYFTPTSVVSAQIAVVDDILRRQFGKDLGFGDDGVLVLDPAVGTGTYLLAALRRASQAVEQRFGPGAVAGRISTVAQQLFGFELLVGSYAVAHLRLAQAIRAYGGNLPPDGPNVLLTDTLESPHAAPPHLAHAPLFERRLAVENERARHVKAETPIVVCIGNPPYFRQVIDPGEAELVERQGGWVRVNDEGEVGILRDFLRGTPPVHAKNLYNLYVYFWRWALWKVFEGATAPGHGVVSFITASSYLRGPAFAGMRRHMREVFDELWIIDLGGDDRGSRRSENVFAIQTPVAIAVGARYGSPHPDPARVHYARIDGTQDEKFEALEAIDSLSDLTWRRCFEGWTQPFLPESAGDYFSWPALTDIFPWQHSGAQFKRTWPIAPLRETLQERWQVLSAAPRGERAGLFKETRDRKVNRPYRSVVDADVVLPALSDVVATDASTPPVRYAFRSFDRQFCLPDGRLGDFLRPSLWKTGSSRQLYLTSLLSDVIGEGPAAVVTHHVPDMHHFSGRGAKDIVPLWRDAAATEPNITAGVIELLTARLGRDVSPVDLFAYCYALLSAPSYTNRFAEELEVPGPRLPMTSEADLFAEGVEHGRYLIWLHTFGERLVPSGQRAGRLPQGVARSLRPVGSTPSDFPTGYVYDEQSRELRLGDAAIAPVSPEAFSYTISGLQVVRSWLEYRMRDGAGRRSSALDEVRPTTWPAAFTEELLEVLWILEATIELGPRLDDWLDRVVAGTLIPAVDMPQPDEAERDAPS